MYHFIMYQGLLILPIHSLLLEKPDISILGGGPTACVPEFFIPHHATCIACCKSVF